jgi:serine-type D-Ala-D-Ala carboxypeptidase
MPRAPTPQLYRPPNLCYNPNIGQAKTLANPFPLRVASGASLQSLVPAFDEQETVFRQTFVLLQKGVAEHVFPAASVAVTHKGKLVAQKAVGRFTYEPNAPEATPDSVFDLASLTKVVATTSMAMILYELGLLDLDMPVVALVPEFAADNPRNPEVTMRMLLAHSSGLPAYEKLFLQTKNRDELLAAAFATQLTADPGSRVEYSDIGFTILGIALERLAEEPLDSFCRREVFGPLGMLHTAFRPPAAWRDSIPPTLDDRTFRKRVVQGEVYDENAGVMGGVAPQAGLFGTAGDLAIFANAMLEGGRPILRPETLVVFTRREASPPGTSRALGWDTPSSPSQSGKYFSPRSFGHLGYTGTSLWIDPDRHLSVALLTNRTWPDAANQAIKQFRPVFHDAVVEALEAQR